MSEYRYKPTTWIGGKTIGTADVMNNIEDGIAKAHERLDNLGDISSGGGSGNVDLSDYATKEELNEVKDLTYLKEVTDAGSGVFDCTRAIKNSGPCLLGLDCSEVWGRPLKRITFSGSGGRKYPVYIYKFTKTDPTNHDDTKYTFTKVRQIGIATNSSWDAVLDVTGQGIVLNEDEILVTSYSGGVLNYSQTSSENSYELCSWSSSLVGVDTFTMSFISKGATTDRPSYKITYEPTALVKKTPLSEVVGELKETIGTKADKTELETLETTLNEHLENHPTGGGEFPTDYGMLGGVIPPSGVNPLDPNTVILFDGKGTGIFTQDYSITSNQISTNSYYYLENGSKDFSNAPKLGWCVISSGAYTEVYAVSEEVRQNLISKGFRNAVLYDCFVDITTVSQLKSDSNALTDYIGKQGQIIVNTDDNTIHVMDGVNAGGTKLATKKELEVIDSKLNEIIEYIYNLPVSDNSVHVKSKTGLSVLKSGAENSKNYKITEKINIKEVISIKTNLTMGVEQ